MKLKKRNYKNKMMIATLAATLLFTPNFANAATYTDLQNAIQNAVTGDTYTIKPTPPSTDTETVTGNLGQLKLSAKSFTIDGTTSKFNIDGNGFAGMSIDSTATQTLSINNIGTISNFKTASDGGFIYNRYGTITNISATFRNNKAGTDGVGGAIYNYSGGKIGTISANFYGNEAGLSGGAISNVGTIDNISGTFDGNKATFGGAINNYDGTIKAINNATFQNNQAKNGGTYNGEGGAIYNSAAKINYLAGVFKNNSADSLGGAIYNDTGYGSDSIINIVADTQDVTFTGNTAYSVSNAIYNMSDGSADAIINLNAGSKSITINDGISGSAIGVINQIININKSIVDISADGASGTYAPTNGTVAINNKVENQTVNLYNGTLLLGQNAAFQDSVLKARDGKLSLQDGSIHNTHLGYVHLHSDMDLKLDADFSGGKSIDTISVDVVLTDPDHSGIDEKIHISDIRILKPTNDKSFSLSPIANSVTGSTRDNLIAAIDYTGGEIVYSPIYKYSAEYDPTTGLLNFGLTSSGAAYGDYNPSIMASPVAALLGGYLTQLNTYDQAFLNTDMYMLMTKSQRNALKLRNKYAAAEGNMTFDPTMTPYDQKAGWFRTYSTFEDVPLNGGPRVSNIGYGAYFGGDSELKELRNGWDGTWGLYVGYNGSHQNYDSVGSYQNGGTIGVVGTVYKGDLFSALTLNVGANGAEANTIYGTDSFSMLMAGIASKTGYNWELKEGKFIIQPSLQLSYSFVNTFDYTNAAGVEITSDPLNVLHIEPGIKLIGNLKNGWQPYLGVSMIWNILDNARFSANDVSLPELSIAPFVKYGLGVQKRNGDRFTGFLQVFFTGGGRNGVGFQFGFRWALGKDPSNGSLRQTNNLKPVLPKAEIKLSSIR